MITHAKILSDLEDIYTTSISEGNLALAIKAKELQSKQLELMHKNGTQKPQFKGIKIDKLIQMAKEYLKKEKRKYESFRKKSGES